MSAGLKGTKASIKVAGTPTPPTTRPSDPTLQHLGNKRNAAASTPFIPRLLYGTQQQQQRQHSSRTISSVHATCSVRRLAAQQHGGGRSVGGGVPMGVHAAEGRERLPAMARGSGSGGRRRRRDARGGGGGGGWRRGRQVALEDAGILLTKELLKSEMFLIWHGLKTHLKIDNFLKPI